MVQYYTLEQAAQILRTTPDNLKEMIKRKEVRAFQDRGTWRFKAQEIDEMARLRGFGSDPELPLGEAPKNSPPAPKRKSQLNKPAAEEEDLFDFQLEGGDEGEDVPIGQDPRPSPSSKSKMSPPPRSPKPGPRKAGGTRSSLGKSPPPKASSDSDVRLVMDGSDLDFQIEIDSDVTVGKDPASAPSKPPSSKKSPGAKKSSRLAPQPPDSGVRIVPLDKPSDSDVKIVPAGGDEVALGQPSAKRPSDSDIRLEEKSAPRPHEPIVTEEIDLDAEASQMIEPPKSRHGKSKASPPKPPMLPTSSPFELSMEGDTGEEPALPVMPDAEGPEDSSDFDLTPAKPDDLSPLEVSSGELAAAPADDDEVSLGELSGAAGASGINLQDPADSGISLEQGGSDEIDFELSLDAGGATPKPAAAQPETDSSSEFELSLDESEASAPAPAAADDSDSEFELSLDADSSPVGDSDSEFELSLDADADSSSAEMEKPVSDSDSEFELTLDESGGLAPLEEEQAEAEEGEKDIFETDFEVPALEEESGSEAVALDEADTDLESSDFDLTPDDSVAEEEASGSQVVPLDTDEEEADAGAATVQRPAVRGKRKKPVAAADDDEAVEEDAEGLDLDLDQSEDEAEDEEEEDEAEPAAAAAAPAAPAEWGIVAPLGAMLCTIVLFVVGLMSFELVQGMMGYHRPGKVSNLVIDPIARMFDEKLPKD